MASRVRADSSTSIFPPTSPMYKIDSQITKIAKHRSADLSPGMAIIFINGMLNGRLDAEESAVDISVSLQKRRVEHVFNDTYSVERTVASLTDKILETAEACRRQLAAASRTSEICIVIIAHSHGAGILEKSLSDPRVDSPIKRNIKVVTIGGAAIIPYPGYRSAENLINEYDFIPLIAHKTFDVATLPDDNTVMQFFIEFAFNFKKKFQEDVLKLESHKYPFLADRILSAMKCSWEASSEETPLQATVNGLCKDIIRSAGENLRSSTITERHLRGFICGILCAAVAHTAYNVTIHKIATESGVISSNPLNDYFETFHSVKSYTPKLSQLVMGYIQEYETQFTRASLISPGK